MGADPVCDSPGSLTPVSAIVLFAWGLCAAPQDAHTSVPVVSVEHVRAGLEKPASKLTRQERPPDFTINITERERFERLVAPILDFKVGPPIRPLFPTAPGSSAALFSVNLLSLAVAAAEGAVALRRAYVKREAREEVRRTILAYCAAQPNGGAGIQICDSSRAAVR